jgi:translocator protein
MRWLRSSLRLMPPGLFRLARHRTALLITIGLQIAIAETIIAASRVERLATWLLAPYLLWVAYATTINIGVVALN